MQNKKQQYGPNCIGNIIRIIDNYSIIIDTGRSRLNIGDTVVVYEYGEPITDLSGNELCHYEFTKARLEVVDVNDKYSVCRTKAVSKTVRALSPLLETTITDRKALDVRQNSIEPLQSYSSVIEKGDPIKIG